MKADGITKRIEILPTSVRIGSKGLFLRAMPIRDIPISAIRAISLQPARIYFFSVGYIRIENWHSSSNPGEFKPWEDPDTVQFRKSQQPQFEALREELLRRLS